MKTGDFRGAGPFAAMWILAEGRQVAPDTRPKVRWIEHAAYPDGLELTEIGNDADGAWIRIEEPTPIEP